MTKLTARVRQESGLTYEQLAAIFASDVTPESVSRWVVGHEECLSTANLRMLKLLDRLLDVIKKFQPEPHRWILSEIDSTSRLTPHDLLTQGRYAEVLEAAIRLSHDPHADISWTKSTGVNASRSSIMMNEDDGTRWEAVLLVEDND